MRFATWSGRQRYLRISSDIANIFVVADEADLPVTPFEPHEVDRLRRSVALENRDHLAALQPGGCQPHRIEFRVDAEEHADVGSAGADRVRGLLKFYVAGEQRPQAIPVALIEQRGIARHR